MKSRAQNVSIRGKVVEVTPVFEAYWRFAAERQSVFFKRLKGENSPALTDDKILQVFKFTNTYRASDRVSQFLIREVIYGEEASFDPNDQFFRVMLFKLFNKIETWQLLSNEIGPVNLESYSFDEFDRVLRTAIDSGVRIYSPAYIMPSAGKVFGYKYKHQNHLKLIEYMLKSGFPGRLCDARSMEQAFDIMLSAPSIGPFLAYQFVTDINYGTLTNFSEMDFVRAGPGALDGISKCFVGGEKLDSAEVIAYMAEYQDFWFDLFEINFPSLFGRPLQLIDCQNIFCEISKYARVGFPEIAGMSGRMRIKQKYAPAGRLPKPWYPPKWDINGQVDAILGDEIQLFGESQQANAVQYTLF